MLASHLYRLGRSRLGRSKPVRYNAEQAGLHPLHLLAAALLADPHLEHVPLLFPQMAQQPGNAAIPGLYHAIRHGGEHSRLGTLLSLLATSGHVPPTEADRVREHLEDIHKRMQAGSPIQEMFTPGTEGYALANQASQEAFPVRLMPMLRRSLTQSDYGRLHPVLALAQHTGDLHHLLTLHHLAGQALGYHGHHGPVGDVWANLRRPIQAGLQGRLNYADLVHRTHQGIDWRPEESTPEDYYA